MSKISLSDGILETFELCGLRFKSLNEAKLLWDQLEKKLDDDGYDIQYFCYSCLDTVDRERLSSELALLFTGIDWPCYGDTEEFKTNFYSLFKAEAVKRGFSIVED